ncbi:CRISPR-associated protein Cas5h [Aquiflexum balticum DSM 16537]|uniref:CRISPR-associated protein Cas5h n=1 Tax=Aquiflexum balticum DSM 16537 TaxID=758820 RepID=A0A1W2H9W7_9BACT|nr:type I-B CRISPR-associated protein Cas5b [Aquiflexum balticum]SMD45356.1 CRISPR-associated protein Cas5h [Aquiflexum balticum DSM 16537]
MGDQAIVFDIWGKYAHFKKIYVTTSALSYALPFKTSIYGIVGAILGFQNSSNAYLQHFQEGDSKIGIQVINPIRFQRININLSPTPGPIKDNRKPTLMEFVTDPHYRIYFQHNDNSLMTKLKDSLKNKHSVFTPVLGLANCLANFSYVGEGLLKKTSGKGIIQTVIPKSDLFSFDQDYWLDNTIHLQEQDMYPLEMNIEREVTKRESILFDLNGRPIKVVSKNHYEMNLNGDNISIMMI